MKNIGILKIPGVWRVVYFVARRQKQYNVTVGLLDKGIEPLEPLCAFVLLSFGF